MTEKQHFISAFTDSEHVSRALKGDASAMDAIIRQYGGLVFSVALSRLDYDEELAEELSQEVFLRAYLNLFSLTNPELLGAWLTQITRNLASDWKRKERRTSALIQMVRREDRDAASLASYDDGPHVAAQTTEGDLQIRSALQKLTPEDREILLLHYGEGLTQTQIARSFSVHPSTIKRKLERAVARLKAHYTKEPALAMSSRQRTELMRKSLGVISVAMSLSHSERTALARLASDDTEIILQAGAWSGRNYKGFMGLTALMILAGVLWIVRPSEYGLERNSNEVPKTNSTLLIISGKGESDVKAGPGSKYNRDSGSSVGRSVKRLQNSDSDMPYSGVGGSHENTLSKEVARQAAAEDKVIKLADKVTRGALLADCMKLKDLIAQLQKYEKVMQQLEYTYVTTVTIEDPIFKQTRSENLEGTVTLKGERFYMERAAQGVSHLPSRGTIFARRSASDLPIMLVNGTSVTVEKIFHDKLVIMAPHLETLSAPLGNASLSSYLISDLSSAPNSVSQECFTDVNGLHVFQLRSINAWQLEFRPQISPVPVNAQVGMGRSSSYRKTQVLELEDFQGVMMPRLITSSGNGFWYPGQKFMSITLITMLKAGTDVTIPDEKFAEAMAK